MNFKTLKSIRPTQSSLSGDETSSSPLSLSPSEWICMTLIPLGGLVWMLHQSDIKSNKTVLEFSEQSTHSQIVQPAPARIRTAPARQTKVQPTEQYSSFPLAQTVALPAEERKVQVDEERPFNPEDEPGLKEALANPPQDWALEYAQVNEEAAGILQTNLAVIAAREDQARDQEQARKSKQKNPHTWGTFRAPASFATDGNDKKTCSLRPPARYDNQCRANYACRLCGGCCCMYEAHRAGKV